MWWLCQDVFLATLGWLQADCFLFLFQPVDKLKGQSSTEFYFLLWFILGNDN